MMSTNKLKSQTLSLFYLRQMFSDYRYHTEQINTFMFMYAHRICIKLQKLNSLCVCVCHLGTNTIQQVTVFNDFDNIIQQLKLF